MSFKRSYDLGSFPTSLLRQHANRIILCHVVFRNNEILAFGRSIVLFSFFFV